MLGCAAVSILPFGSNTLAELTGISMAMWAIRLLAAVGMIALAFGVHRRGGNAPLALAVGSAVFFLAVADLFLFGHAWLRDKDVSAITTYRYPYDLQKISNHDIVLVGDSFVWGQGVAQGQEFGALMQSRITSGVKILMLGQIGTGPVQYLKSILALSQAAPARRVVVCYYHNDLPAPELWVDRIQALGGSMGRGVPSLRFVGDMIAKSCTSTPQRYLQKLVENYSPGSPEYPARTALLKSKLKQCFDAAKARSVECPGLLILPGLLDFDGYPFAEGHKMIGGMAKEIGFEVFDSIGAFQKAGISAEQLWVAPNDPHFNEKGHQITADFLMDCLRLNS